VTRLLRWYGSSPLHLLAMIGSFALAGYAAPSCCRQPFGILVWFVAAVIGHDLLLMPLYTLADRSVMAVFRHHPLKLPACRGSTTSASPPCCPVCCYSSGSR